MNRRLVLAAMVFAVAMTTIDQTIVAIAIPDIAKDLDLSPTGSQWVINGYVLALAALFAFGGKVADVVGRRTMVVVGIVAFAVTSAACGLTPHGAIAEPWIVFWRVLQGAAAAFMFPAAVGIVISTFPLHERGRAMAIFFGVSGGLTAVGPISGGYLAEWTWRAIFWVNIPIALISLFLLWRAKPVNEAHPAPLDYRGAGLAIVAMGLVVLGLQQSASWGWSSPATWLCLIVGVAAMVVFVFAELRTPNPLLELRIFRDRAFAVETAVLGIVSVVFIPFFFFGSVYAQAALGLKPTEAGLYMLYFFLGFVVASQIGGRMLDRAGARRPVVFGTAISTVGFVLLAGRLTHLQLGAQWLEIAIAGAGIGMMLTPASTDTVNRAPASSYSEVTGITQTARNFGASLGLAVLGAMLIDQNKTNLAAALVKHGVPAGTARQIAATTASGAAPTAPSTPQPAALIHDVHLAFAHSTQTVFYACAGVMGAAFLVAFLWLPRGRVEEDEPEVAAEGELARA